MLCRCRLHVLCDLCEGILPEGEPLLLSRDEERAANLTRISAKQDAILLANWAEWSTSPMAWVSRSMPTVDTSRESLSSSPSAVLFCALCVFAVDDCDAEDEEEEEEEMCVV